MTRVTTVILCMLMLASTTASATPYDVYGGGARGAAMGSAQTSIADGPEALYYNPGQLANSTLGLTVGMLATFGRPQIVLQDRPNGYDIPDIGPPVRSVASANTQRERSDTELTDPLVGLQVGAVAPLIFDGLHVGFMIFIPLPTPVTLRTYFADERERIFSNQLHFERLGRRVHQLDLQFGLAYRVTEWLSVGIGAAYLPGFAVDTGVYLPDATDQSDAELNADISTENDFGLLAGATFDLPSDFSVGVSFRDATAMRVTTDNAIQINGVAAEDPIIQQASWTPIYSPARAALGIAWSPGDWVVSVDGRYTFWSGYEDAQGDPTDFANVVSPALGAEWNYSESTSLRSGVGFEPSPVPDQTGRTNYVDNHRVHFSFGAGHLFSVGEREFDVSWHVRLQTLITRSVAKEALDDYPDCGPGVEQLCDEVPDDLRDPSTGQPFEEARGLQTGNPGFPGFASGGWLGSLGVELRY